MIDRGGLALIVIGSTCLLACAPSYTVPVPVDGAVHAADPKRVEAFSTSETPDSEVLLRRDGKPLDEATFEKDYLERVRDDDLERLAREKRRRTQGRVLLSGTASLVIGGGALTFLAATQTPLCEPNSSNCGKAILGAGILALVAGVGVFTIGCIAIAGPDCGIIGHPPLERREAETIVKRYNETVAGSATELPSPIELR
jgi:hypothetical protein